MLAWEITHEVEVSVLPVSLKAGWNHAGIHDDRMRCGRNGDRNVRSAIDDRHWRYGYALQFGMQGDVTRKAVTLVQR